MVRKILGKSRKIKKIDQYLGDVGVYDLSRPLRSGKEKISFLLISKSKPRSGGMRITAWYSDEHGAILNSNPVTDVTHGEISDVLEELGYNLI